MQHYMRIRHAPNNEFHRENLDKIEHLIPSTSAYKQASDEENRRLRFVQPN